MDAYDQIFAKIIKASSAVSMGKVANWHRYKMADVVMLLGSSDLDEVTEKALVEMATMHVMAALIVKVTAERHTKQQQDAFLKIMRDELLRTMKDAGSA